MEKINYKLDIFEGPLDLLLHLISKHKLDICDIPIFELIEQYINYVRQMQEENLDVASEFLEMAARLVYIKTVSLLPVYEEAEQLKKELEGELIEYRDAKLAAQMLSLRTEGFERIVRNPLKINFDMTYNRFHEAFELSQAYISAAGKHLRGLPPPVETFIPIVSRKIVAVSDKIENILSVLKKKKKQKLKFVFENASSRSELVASFLAVLELVKNKQIYIDGEGSSTEIILKEKSKE